MSDSTDYIPVPQMSEVVLANQQAADCLIPMGITSTCFPENSPPNGGDTS
jgi:hypothetical protein